MRAVTGRVRRGRLRHIHARYAGYRYCTASTTAIRYRHTPRNSFAANISVTIVTYGHTQSSKVHADVTRHASVTLQPRHGNIGHVARAVCRYAPLQATVTHCYRYTYVIAGMVGASAMLNVTPPRHYILDVMHGHASHQKMPSRCYTPERLVSVTLPLAPLPVIGWAVDGIDITLDVVYCRFGHYALSGAVTAIRLVCDEYDGWLNSEGTD